MKKGFTLIELLMVIAIIGILLSIILVNLQSVRKTARDDARITDLKQVQQALELFKSKCGFYPGRYDPLSSGSSRCRGGSDDSSEMPFDKYNPISWSALGIFLNEAEIGASVIPVDPVPSQNYFYRVQYSSSGKTPRAQCYILGAQMETQRNDLSNDLNNVDLINKLQPLPPTCSALSCKNLFPDTIDCDGLNYCVGNSECFYGN